MKTKMSRAGRENRQSNVLDAAAALFREKGYEGTSLRGIAAASGMLPGSIYFHFYPRKRSSWRSSNRASAISVSLWTRP